MANKEFPEKGNFSKPQIDLNRILSKKITKYLSFGTLSLGGCLGFMLIVVIIALMLSPLFHVNNKLDRLSDNSFTEKLANFLTLRGWCTDIECDEKEENDFYEAIEKVYNDYLDKGVEINVNLITATLTYTDPFIITTGDETTNMVDFKKSKKKIDELATYMVNEKDIIICYSKETNVEVSCDTDIEVIRKTKKIYVYDEDKYKKYLKEDFIKKFYFNNKNDSDIDSKIDSVIKEIFERVEYFEILTNTKASDNFAFNNSSVQVLDCNGILLEEVSLYEYLQGVLYLEGFATNRDVEFLKVMAIAAKNYLYALNGATIDNIPTSLKIRSCQLNQIYCSVSDGCHMRDDGIDEVSSTVASGSDEFGEYYLQPLESIEVLEKIKKAIDETFNEFIVKDGKFVVTQYRSSCNGTCDSTNNILDQSLANQMINNGDTYKDVLNYFYDGDIETLELFAVGYPLDLKNNIVTSAYGWRVHPINNCCRHHNGTDIAADYNDKIYSIADGIVITVDDIGSSSYGYYVVIKHDDYYSLYAHQNKTIVNVGDEVKIGQQIGYVGSTGNSTGPHLHIEIYTIIDEKKVRQDPVEYFKNIKLEGAGGTLYESKDECQRISRKGVCS